MKEFLISERYRLELHWYDFEYIKEDHVKLFNCFFSGPVLNDIAEIRNTDYMLLDFGKQYSNIVSSYYVAKLSWDGIRITNDKIHLYNVEFTNRHLNSVPKFKNGDHIVIDTSNHEVENHYKNFNYRAYLLNSYNVLYNFRR